MQPQGHKVAVPSGYLPSPPNCPANPVLADLQAAVTHKFFLTTPFNLYYYNQNQQAVWVLSEGQFQVQHSTASLTRQEFLFSPKPHLFLYIADGGSAI